MFLYMETKSKAYNLKATVIKTTTKATGNHCNCMSKIPRKSNCRVSTVKAKTT